MCRSISLRADSAGSRAHRRHSPWIGVWCALTILGGMTASPAAADVYDDFNEFADSAYGAFRDPLILERFGTVLEPPRDWWIHISESSAAVSFTTNLPARTYVEYGPTTAYGQATEKSERAFYQHLHHLRGLSPGVEHHYRVVMENEQGVFSAGPDRVVTPLELPQAIRIPADVVGPPYVLDVPGAYYLVTADVLADSTAFEVVADSVTLDLGGHDITYNQALHTNLSDYWYDYRNMAAYGIRSLGPDGVRVYNGVIRQGAGNNGGHPEGSVGFSPIFTWEAADLEIAGTVVEYTGSQLVGITTHWQKQDIEIHHNVVVDRGTGVENRHGIGSAALGFIGGVSGVQVHHNLVKRTRQNGVNGESIHDNEIYIDSYATNSFGIGALTSGREGFGNKIFGTGYHVVGIGWGANNWWHDNFIHLVGQGPDFRYTEYGNQESLNGFRLTQYTGATEDLSNSVVEDNLVLVTDGACSFDGECTQVRGLQYSSDPYVVDNLIRRNTIKVVMDDVVTQAAAIVTQGQFSRCGTESPLVYSENTLISNIANVRMGDYAGVGCNHHFVDNSFVRVGTRDDYRTLRFDAPRATQEHYFHDSTFEGGAGYDPVEFTDAGQSIDVGWTLSVSVSDGLDPVEGAAVTFSDKDGNLLSSGVTDAAGLFTDAVVAYQQSAFGRRIHLSPIEVVVQYGPATETRSVELWKTTQIEVELSVPTSNPSNPTQTSLQLAAVPLVMGHETEFRWSIPSPTTASLHIFDLRGRSVQTIPLSAGSVAASWNGRDRHGRSVGSGVYLARLRTGRVDATCRVIVLR